VKRRLLWVGDAAVDSGFAKVTHSILTHLVPDWDIFILGINYLGDPHPYPYQIFPAYPGGDGFGLKRMREVIGKVGPDIVVVQNDPWNIRAYMDRAISRPVVAIMPVDGRNCKATGLNGLAMAVFWTQFGLQEAREGGYVGPATVIPLGVDTSIYKAMPREEARKIVGLPARMKDGFIIGTVNRNQPRKRFDLLVLYFCEWVKTRQVNDAFLFIHTCPTPDDAYDVQQLMSYFGMKNRLILSEPGMQEGIPEEKLAVFYNSFDIMLTTTQGEGWGLTTMEGMACGIPQVIPVWSALGEWALPAAAGVRCSSVAATANHGINVLGGIMDKQEALTTLDQLYGDPLLRSNLEVQGIELVNQQQFRWKNIAAQYSRVFDEVYVNRFDTRGEVVVNA